MRPIKTGIALKVFVFLLLPLFAIAQERYSKVKIFAPSDSYQRAELMGLLEIDHFLPTTDGAIVSEISQHCLLKLKSSSYAYEILVPDVAKRLDSLNRIYYRTISRGRVAIEQPGSAVSAIIQTPSAFQVKGTFGGYYSYAEMATAIDNLVTTYPTIAQKINIGTTAGGRTLWLVKISDNVATDEANEPEVLYLGLQHAREAITGSSMIFYMQYLCERYAANDTRIVSLVNNREIYIVPCFNPDGWEYNRSTNPSGGGGWRKNRNGAGVDLNRNWGVDWANCSAPILGSPTSCGSSSSAQETYWGTSAFSENETKAVRDFVKSHHVVAGFDQHAYGPYYSLPFGRHSLHTMSAKGQNFYTAIPALMGTYNGMRAADSYDALGYEVAGGFKDWMLMGDLGSSIGSGLKDTVWAMTGEGAAGGGSGGTYSDFWAPASQIINLCRSMCYQNLQLAFAAGTYVDITDGTDMALTSKTGSLTCNVKRIGLGNAPVTITLVPIQNMTSVGSPVVINSMNYYDSLNVNINYTLPAALANGQRVKFAWQVNTGGYTYSDTVIKLFNATTLLYDNMEGSLATNWTNTASGGASGFGYNYTAGNWVFTTGGYKSTQALSESANGTNYTGSSIRTIQYNSTFDLSNATSAYLSFWARYRAENFRDKVQVQVSTNGTTWTTIRGTHTIEEPGILDDATINGQPSLTGIHDYWMRENFDLTAYNGQAALRLRFVFTSDNDPSTFAFEREEGFFIDNLSVMKTTSPLVVLPVNFLNFTGTLLPNNTVKLNWEASTDADHDYFLIERSADGKDFVTLAHGAQSLPYSYVDVSPLDGKNFYRIKQMNKNGSFTYSNVISINLGKGNKINIFPNPVTDILSIRLKNPESDQLKIEIADVNGKAVYGNMYFVNENTAELRVDMSLFKRQVYILRISNSRGELISTQKIIKL